MVHNMIRLYGEELFTQFPNWRTTPCLLSATAYSIYSQPRCIIKAVRPSSYWGRAMPWWQGTHLLRTAVKWGTEINKQHTLSHSQVFECLTLDTCSERSRNGGANLCQIPIRTAPAHLRRGSYSHECVHNLAIYIHFFYNQLMHIYVN